MLNYEQYKMKKQFTTWRFMAIRAFQEDPYECKKCKYKIKVPIEAAKEWEEKDMWNRLDKSIPPYGECRNCN